MKGILAAALTGLLGLSPTSSTAETVIVDQDGLASIYTRIQDGIDAVSDGGEVLVMASLSSTVTFRGTGNRDLDFHGKNITLRGVYGKQNTFIDCEGAARAFNLSAGTDSTSLIEGFTIQNGYADDAGGAIESEGGVPRISDCVFRGNTAAFGGAIRLTQGFTRFTGCRFYGNSATEYGGAVYAAGAGLVLEGCSFSDNDSSDGGALFHIAGDLTVRNCTFANNLGSAGAAVVLQSSTAVLEQCIVAFNRVGKGVVGGAAEIFHCYVYGNQGGDDLPGNAHDNESADPRFCDLYGVNGGNLSLCSNSGCLAVNNPWGLHVGSGAQGCSECDSPVEASTWTGIKALYR